MGYIFPILIDSMLLLNPINDIISVIRLICIAYVNTILAIVIVTYAISVISLIVFGYVVVVGYTAMAFNSIVNCVSSYRHRSRITPTIPSVPSEYADARRKYFKEYMEAKDKRQRGIPTTISRSITVPSNSTDIPY